MTKDISEIASEMEGNLSNSMKILEELCGLDFCKEISTGILGKQGDEVIVKIFEVG
jgi:hypothetical protein